ncbi:MAG: sulfate transporter [Colwelliaceae bacterium]|nr:sulfate transporter [Colwelliaceae bacterium]|tara:strand:+ start:398 stop:1090 length:693 start_codon:yes stop_codon:yes gene_type:complete
MTYIDKLYRLTKPEAPSGFIEDGDGNLRRKDRVKPIEIERDLLTRKLFSNAILVHEELQSFTQRLKKDVAEFVSHAMKTYDKRLGGTKGNVTLYSFDRKIKIERSRQDRLCFNENLVAAKAMIDECIKRWSKGSNKNLQAIVQGAFKTDKKGRFSAAKVLSLRQHNIQDEQWQLAMQALADAIEVDSSAEYFRIYYREENGTYRQLALDIADITTLPPQELENEHPSKIA